MPNAYRLPTPYLKANLEKDKGQYKWENLEIQHHLGKGEYDDK